MIFDTSAWIEFLINSEKTQVIERIIENEKCFTCNISIAELSAWIEKEKLGRKIIDIIKKNSVIIDVDHEILEKAGIVKMQKRKKIKNFVLIDAIILSTAREYGQQILTKDKHFSGENVLML